MVRVKDNLKREICEQSFSYGNHTIVIRVLFEREYVDELSPNLQYGDGGIGYYQHVEVEAYQTSKWEEKQACACSDGSCSACVDPEVSSESFARITIVPEIEDISVRVGFWRVLLGAITDRVNVQEIEHKKKQREQEKLRRQKGPAVDVQTQIRETAEPVLERVDEHYKVLERDIDIDVDVSVDRMSAETAWVDVEDEISRLSKEIDAIAE